MSVMCTTVRPRHHFSRNYRQLRLPDTRNTSHYYGPRQDSTENPAERSRNSNLLKAAAGGQRIGVERLLAAGADTEYRDQDDFTALHHAVLSGFEDVVRILIASGADVNAHDEKTGSTPLHLAAAYGYTKLVLLLIDPCADTGINDSEHTVLLTKL